VHLRVKLTHANSFAADGDMDNLAHGQVSKIGSASRRAGVA
jgi:hypothetical protein